MQSEIMTPVSGGTAALLTPPAFDDAKFRDVLGHYPTGVSVITADVGGEHLGMVVGSFTSVSLKPPLVAYLADHNSKTYAKLKQASHFVINILAADQEALCRRFASKTINDKWADVAWEPASNGARKISGSVAHIQCSHAATHVAGDHDIVIGAVQALAVENADLPLMFFQGAMGRFAGQSLTIPSSVAYSRPLRIADRARPLMEELVKELGSDCLALAKIDDQLVFSASFQPENKGEATPKVGHRVPHVAPLGTPFIAWESAPVADPWMDRLGSGLTADGREYLRAALDRVRARGYSVAVEAGGSDSLDRLRGRFSVGRSTPAEERALRDISLSLIEQYEPEDLDAACATGIRVITVPVFSAERRVELGLQIWTPPVKDARSLEKLAQRLQVIASRVAAEA